MLVYKKNKQHKVTGMLSSEKEEKFDPESPFKIRNFAKEFFQRPTKTNFKAKYTKTHTHSLHMHSAHPTHTTHYTHTHYKDLHILHKFIQLEIFLIGGFSEYTCFLFPV